MTRASEIEITRAVPAADVRKIRKLTAEIARLNACLKERDATIARLEAALDEAFHALGES